jgi:hypothetical protein
MAAVAKWTGAPAEPDAERIAVLAKGAECLLRARGQQNTTCIGGYHATATGVSHGDPHLTMIAPSPRFWGKRPKRTPVPERTCIRVDVHLSGEGNVLSYDRVGDGAVVLVQFHIGEWEATLLRLGN